MFNALTMIVYLCITIAIFSVSCNPGTCDRTRPVNDSNRSTSLTVTITWGEGTNVRHVRSNGSPITANIPTDEGFIISANAKDPEGIQRISIDIVYDEGNGEGRQRNYHSPPKVYQCRAEERTHALGIDARIGRTFRIIVRANDYFGNQRSIPNITVNKA